jgi:hypothetical protein
MSAGMPDKCTTSFLRIEPSLVGSRRTGRVLCLVHGEAPGEPNPGCMVCSKAAMHLTANTEVMTLQQLVDKASAAAAAAAALFDSKMLLPCNWWLALLVFGSQPRVSPCVLVSVQCPTGCSASCAPKPSHHCLKSST